MASKGKQIAGEKGYSSKRKRQVGNGSEASRRSQKRKDPGVLKFFDDVAEDDDEYLSSDDSDFDNGMEEEFTSEKIKSEPGKNHSTPLFPKEEELDEEEFDKMMEERYKEGSRFIKHAEDDYEAKKSVERSFLIPITKDPVIWKIKCMVGRERHSAFCLMQKFVHLKALGTKLQIISAFAVEHVKGFIYIEAEKQRDVIEACKGLSSIYSTRVTEVPTNEVSHLLSVRSKSNEVSEGTWARVKNGKYKGDLAQVVAVNNARKKATIKLIPRIDLQAMAQKYGGGITAKKGVAPAPRLISSSELEEFRPLIQIRRDRDTGMQFEIFDGMMLKNGYLYKKVSMDSLSFWGVMPSQEEILKFKPSESNESDDLEWLSQLYGGRKKKRVVKVDEGARKEEGTSGSGSKAEGTSGSGSKAEGPSVSSGKGEGSSRSSGKGEGSSRSTEKGEGSSASTGKGEGTAGSTGKGEGTAGGTAGSTGKGEGTAGSTGKGEGSSRSSRKGEGLSASTGKGEGTSRFTGKGEDSSWSGVEDSFVLHNLVCFCRKDFGLIIGIEKDDCYKILKEGSEGPVVVTVQRKELKSGPLETRFTALDRHMKTVSINDVVKIAEGPCKGKQGIVKQVYRGTIFLYDESETEYDGYLCCKSSMCEKIKLTIGACNEKGGESGPSGFGDFLSSPKSPLSPKKPWEARESNSNFNRGDKDSMFSIGQTLRIRVGPLKGYLCRVLAIRYSDVTVKLDSQHKVLTVRSEHLSEVRGTSSTMSVREDPRSNSFKPFDLLGTEGSSGDWIDRAGTSADDDNWNAGGHSAERSSWPSFPASGSSLQPESNSPNLFGSKDKDVRDLQANAWEDKVISNQNSSWGTTAAASEDPLVNNDLVGGWNSWSKATIEAGSGNGASDGWGKALVATGDPIGSSNNVGDSWGQAKRKFGSLSDAEASWGKNENVNNDEDGWKNSGELWAEEKNVAGNRSGSWDDASADKSLFGPWDKGKAVIDMGSKEKSKNTSGGADQWSNETSGWNQRKSWDKGKDIKGDDGPTSSNTVASQADDTDKGIQEDSWGKAARKWSDQDCTDGNKSNWNSVPVTEKPTGGWGNAGGSWAQAEAENTDEASGWKKAKVGSGSETTDLSSMKKFSGDAACWSKGGSCNQAQSESWNKPKAFGAEGGTWKEQDGDSIWGKQEGVSSWSKQDGGSNGARQDGGSWGKQVGTSSWGEQNGGSSWSKQDGGSSLAKQEGDSSWSKQEGGSWGKQEGGSCCGRLDGVSSWSKQEVGSPRSKQDEGSCWSKRDGSSFWSKRDGSSFWSKQGGGSSESKQDYSSSWSKQGGSSESKQDGFPWNKQDGGSSWSKQNGVSWGNRDGDSSWNKQEGSSWDKQGGGSSWSKEDEGCWGKQKGGSSWSKQDQGSSWSKQADQKPEDAWNRTKGSAGDQGFGEQQHNWNTPWFQRGQGSGGRRGGRRGGFRGGLDQSWRKQDSGSGSSWGKLDGGSGWGKQGGDSGFGWGKQDGGCGSSWGKQDGGSGWGKQDGGSGSSWGKQDGSSGWGKQGRDSGSGWGKQDGGPGLGKQHGGSDRDNLTAGSAGVKQDACSGWRKQDGGSDWGKQGGGSCSSKQDGGLDWGKQDAVWGKQDGDAGWGKQDGGSGGSKQDGVSGWDKPDGGSDWGKQDCGSSWNKQDGGSSLCKQDGGSDWGKQDSGSGWTKQEGRSGCGQQDSGSGWAKQDGGSSWSKQSYLKAETKDQDDRWDRPKSSGGEQVFDGWNKGRMDNRADREQECNWGRPQSFDGGRGSRGRRGGFRGGRSQFGRGRSFDRGQTSGWNKHGQENSMTNDAWSTDQGGRFGNAKASDGGREDTWNKANASCGDSGSNWKKGWRADDNWQPSNASGGGQQSTWDQSAVNKEVKDTNIQGAGWNKGSDGTVQSRGLDGQVVDLNGSGNWEPTVDQAKTSDQPDAAVAAESSGWNQSQDAEGTSNASGKASGSSWEK